MATKKASTPKTEAGRSAARRARARGANPTAAAKVGKAFDRTKKKGG